MANFCENCGTPLNNDDRFCSNCGAPVTDDEVSRHVRLLRHAHRDLLLLQHPEELPVQAGPPLLILSPAPPLLQQSELSVLNQLPKDRRSLLFHRSSLALRSNQCLIIIHGRVTDLYSPTRSSIPHRTFRKPITTGRENSPGAGPVRDMNRTLTSSPCSFVMTTG